MTSKWQPVVLENGQKTVYREDEFGNEQIHVNDKKTGITLTSATPKDVEFMVNVIFNTILKETLKADMFRRNKDKIRKSVIKTVQLKICNLEEDEINLFLIIRNNKNRIGYCKIIGSKEISSYAEVRFAFYDEKKRRIYQDKVVKTLNMICKKHRLFDWLYFYEGGKKETIYKYQKKCHNNKKRVHIELFFLF